MYSKAEDEIQALGRTPTREDMGELVHAYCADCTREVEEAHDGHDQLVSELREALDDWRDAG